jgi:hypothetical protein
MRKLRASRRAQTELFPFLSVLACIIGTLILLVITVSSTVLGTRRSVTLSAREQVGENKALVPHYIEVRADGVVLHPTLEFVRTRDLKKPDRALRRLLRQVAANASSEYIIVAVRPDGFGLFDTVRSEVEGRRIRIGYEPVPAEWKLRIRR